ncbi:MAG TPA: IS630 family transposase [Deltaproteobacteria bacterium]|nr:IS630 family transposase [Deltaproteobacteria bacterium]
MPRKTKRAKLVLRNEDIQELTRLSKARKEPARVIQRAKILLLYHSDRRIKEIVQEVGANYRTVCKCLDKALSMGVVSGLKDTAHRPFEPVITPEAKAWVIHLSCNKPKDYGYAAELWTRSLLAKHVRKHSKEAGHPSLARAAPATIQRILKENKLRPDKIRYYLERRDPEFERKMREVLMVYQEVAIESEKKGDGREVYTVSVDEKPGVQAIENTAPDLPPVPGQHKEWGRDHEYKRHGTVSILASLDLQDGHVIGRVENRHRSIEFIGLLKDLDAHYPPEATIRIILDNHSAHTSKETRAYLATRPNRFHYVHTPTHGSWLNLVETLFGKMARTFLKQIRVKSKQELKERILKGIDEINAAPVVHRWKKFDLLKAS